VNEEDLQILEESRRILKEDNQNNQEAEATVEPEQEEQGQQPSGGRMDAARDDGAMEATVEAEGDDGRGVMGYAGDILQGIASGAQDGIDATIGMAEDGLEVAVESVGERPQGPNTPVPNLSEEETNYDFSTESNLGAIPEAETTAGQLASGLSQFTVGMLGAGKILNAAKWAKGTQRFARSMVQGGMADFAAFEENEQRLSNLIEEQVPELSNPVSRYLAADEDDGFFEGRLKNTIEGAGLGAAGDLLFRSVKFMKNGKKAAAQGDEAGVKAAQDQMAEANDKMARQAAGEEPRTDFKEAGTLDTDTSKPNLTGAERNRVLDETEVIQSSSKNPEDVVLNDPAEVAQAQQMFRMASEGEVTWDEAFQFIPFRHPEKFNQFGDYLSVYSDRVGKVLKDRGGVEMGQTQSMDEVIRLAEKNASTPEETLLALQRFGGQKDDISGLIAAGRAIYEGAEQNIRNKVRAWKTGEGSKEDALAAIDYFAGVQRALRDSATTSGRSLNVHKITTKDGAAADADRIAQIVNHRNIYGNEEDFLDELDKVGIDDTGTIGRVIDSSYARKAWDFHNETWLNGLLGGLKTQVINQTSNAIQSLLSPIETAAGALARRDVRSMRTGASQLGGLVQYSRDALRFAGRSAKEENPLLDPFDNLKTEEVGANKVTSEVLGAAGQKIAGQRGQRVGDLAGQAIRLPSRGLMAGDEFWKQLNYRSRLYSQAIDEASRKGLSTQKTIDRGNGKLISEFDQYVAERFQSGFDETGKAIDERALQYAREQTFTNDLLPGTLGKWVQEGVQKHPSLRLIMPFVRTPTNLIRQTWKRTPGLNMLQQEYRQALKSPDPLVKSQAYGQMMSGGLLWTLGATLAMNGQITGGGPTNPDMRSKLREQGWQPYSLKLGDKYYQFDRLDPLGMIFGIAGDYAEIGAELNDKQVEELSMGATLAAAKSIFAGDSQINGEKMSAFTGQAIASLPQNLASKTYLKSLTDTMEAVFSGETGQVGNWFKSRVSSYVPNYLGQTKRAQDPLLLETRSAMDEVKASIPGMGDDIEAQRNVFGEPQMRSGSPLNRFLSPVAISERKNDPVVEEMIRLGKGFPPAPDERGNIKLYQFKNSEGKTAWSAWNDYIKNSGMKERLTDLVQSDSYQQLSDGVDKVEQTYPGTKGHLINKTVNQYQKKAFQQFLQREGGSFTSESGLPISEAWRNEEVNRARSKAGYSTDDLLPIE